MTKSKPTAIGPKVLVLDGEARCALAVVQVLGREGVEVHAASSERKPTASTSRYVRRFHSCPSSRENRTEFIQWLIETHEEQRFDCILPLTDCTIFALLYSGRAAKDLPVPLPERKAVEIVYDKAALLGMAAESGIPTAPYEVPESAGQLSGVTERLGTPVVVKATRSYDWTRRVPVYMPVRYARDEKAARSIAATIWKEGAQPLLQRFLPGWGMAVGTLWLRGKLTALECHVVERTWPVGGSISVSRRSVPIASPVVDRALILLERLGWHGPAQLEFIADEHMKRVVLLEINGRFWGSTGFCVRVGPNIPYMLFLDTTGQPVPPQLEYRLNFSQRWLLGEIKRVYSLFFDRERLEDTPNVPSRMQALAALLNPKGPYRFDSLALDDPVPFLFENTIEAFRSFKRRKGASR